MSVRSLARLAVLLVQSQTPALGSADERPVVVVKDVVLVGVTAYGRDDLMRALGLRPGEGLTRGTDALAAALERRYRFDGYLAVRASAAYDEAGQQLTLTVDEGRLASVTVEGLSGRGESRARRELGLDLGAPLRKKDLLVALGRLATASDGALQAGDPAYQVESRPEGVHLVVRPRTRRADYRVGPRGPAGAAFDQRVDGLSPWIGGELTVYDRAAYHHLRLYVRATYGFASERGGFVAGASRPLGPRLVLGGEVHDFTDTDDRFRATGLEETLGTLLVGSSFRDYFRRRGGEAHGFLRISSRAQVGVSFRGDRHASLETQGDWSLLGGPSPRPNPPAAPGRLRSLIAAGRWVSSGSLFDDPAAERESFLLRDLYGTDSPQLEAVRAEASLEIASARRLGGDFTFRRLIAQLRGRRDVGPARSIGARLLAGFTDGEPPPQRRFALGGLGTLRGSHYKEAVGDHAVLASVEYGGWAGFPRPGVVLFYDGGAAWSRGARGRWRNDLGFGLLWGRGARPALRVDVGFPLDRGPGRDRARATVRLHAPF